MPAASTDLLQEVSIATATTLDAPGYTIGDPTVTVASTSGMSTATGITFAMDVIDSEGVQVPGSYNEYVGVVSSGTSITSVSHQNGTNRNYSAGATTRVYIPVSAERENRIVEWGLEEHNQDGTHSAITTSAASTFSHATGVTTNTITERTAASGVTIDGVLLKDNKVATAGAVENTAVMLGMPVQMVATSSAATTSGTTVLPVDNTIPQNTEGIEVMTLAITPKSATNILVIEAQGLIASSVANNVAMALFQDSTANALSATNQFQAQAGGDVNLSLGYSMVAATTSATTFKIRVGGNGAGTTTFGNGRFSTTPHGYLKITEYKAS